MTRPPLVSFWVVVAIAGSAVTLAEDAPLPAPSPAAVSPASPARPRAVSPAVAAQLSAAVPKFDATLEKPAEPAVVPPATDKPRNTIVRLPSYLVQEEKPRVFKEREMLTTAGRLHEGLKQHPGLLFGSFWIFRNDGIALAMQAEDERLERKREFEDLASLLRFSSPVAHTAARQEVQQAFMREADFGR